MRSCSTICRKVPNTSGLELDGAGVACDERGRVVVDDHFKTNVNSIFAIGDVIRGPMLAHKAEEEGVACVEYIATDMVILITMQSRLWSIRTRSG